MKKVVFRSGFTIIEVLLVLAISSLMLVGLMVSISVSISRQRYNDAVQSFGEYLRSTYSSVMNVRNSRRDGTSNFRSCTLSSQASSSTPVDTEYKDDPSYITNTEELSSFLGYPGRSECAIYGKLITIGEVDAQGNAYGSPSMVHEYDVIGRAINSADKLFGADLDEEGTGRTSNGVLLALSEVGADVVSIQSSDNQSLTECKVTAAGNYGSYTPQWESRIENPDQSLFKGSILIVRSPVTGAIHTFFHPEVINITDIYNSYAGQTVSCGSASSLNSTLRTLADHLVTDRFEAKEINFCLDNEDILELGRRRRNIRIVEDGNNASSIELVDQDSEDNKCL